MSISARAGPTRSWGSQRQPSSGDLPEVPAEHRLVKARVRMPLVDEVFSPTAVGEFTASQGHPLEVERCAEDKPAPVHIPRQPRR